MDRNSLFAIAVILAVVLGGAYYVKTKGQGFKGFDKMFAPTPKIEDWKKDDPGWERLKMDPPTEVAPPSPPSPQPSQPSQPKREEQPRQRPDSPG